MGPFQLSGFYDSLIVKLNYSWAVCTTVVCAKDALLGCVWILPAQKIKDIEPWWTRKWSSGGEVNETNGSCIYIRQTVTMWLNLLFIISINVKHDAHTWKTKVFCDSHTLCNTKQCSQDIDLLILIKTYPSSFRQQKEPGGLGDCSNVRNIWTTLEHQIPEMPD